MSESKKWEAAAIEKLQKEQGAVIGQKEKAMVKEVSQALMDFCRQDEEFAQAICQGGSLKDCMKAVANGVGNSISDIEAYRKAVQFYFPGAKVHMHMTIDLIGDAACPAVQQEVPTKNEIILNLEDFL